MKDTVRKVTRTQPEVFEAYGEEKHLVAVMDNGVKQKIIECLRRRGCKVVAMPACTPAGEVLSGGFDGVMLSNGPGDPEENILIWRPGWKLQLTVRKLCSDLFPGDILFRHQFSPLVHSADQKRVLSLSSCV